MSAFSGAGLLGEADKSPVRGSNARKSGRLPEMLRAGAGLPVATADAPGKACPTTSANTVSGVTVRIGAAGG